ncbi:MAG: DUF3426 domain-containing protein [Phreatobacter sp.]|nr:DUF3426 domain-containing protein [Phreatobacter sp.]
MLIVCPSCATAFRVTKTVLGDAGRQVRCAQCRTVWLATPESAVEEQVQAPAAAERVGASAGGDSQGGDDADWGAAFAEEAESKAGGDALAEPAVPEDEVPSIQPDADVPPLPARAAEPDEAERSSPEAKRIVRDEREPSGLRRLRRPSLPRPGGQSFRLSPSYLILLLGTAILAMFFLGREQVVRTVPDSAGLYESIGLPVNLRGVEFRDVKGANEVVDGVVVLVVEGRLVNITGRPVELPRLRLSVRDAAGKEIYTWTATAPKARLEAGEAAPFRSRLASPPPDGASVEVRFFTRVDATGR